jgi:hypothetical protein
MLVWQYKDEFNRILEEQNNDDKWEEIEFWRNVLERLMNIALT